MHGTTGVDSLAPVSTPTSRASDEEEHEVRPKPSQALRLPPMTRRAASAAAAFAGVMPTL